MITRNPKRETRNMFASPHKPSNILLMRVLVFGTFDRLHPGHRFVLDAASKRGTLGVVVARDANVLRIKGRHVQESETKRKRAIAQEYPKAEIILGDAVDFLAPVRMFAPGLILLGYDQKLPPGVSEKDLPCPIERLPAFEPETYKSSLDPAATRVRKRRGSQPMTESRSG